MEKAVIIWIENQNNHNIPLSQSLIQNNSSIPWRLREVRTLQEEKKKA